MVGDASSLVHDRTSSLREDDHAGRREGAASHEEASTSGRGDESVVLSHTLSMFAGVGIVKGSQPLSEWQVWRPCFLACVTVCACACACACLRRCFLVLLQVRMCSCCTAREHAIPEEQQCYRSLHAVRMIPQVLSRGAKLLTHFYVVHACQMLAHINIGHDTPGKMIIKPN